MSIVKNYFWYRVSEADCVVENLAARLLDRWNKESDGGTMFDIQCLFVGCSNGESYKVFQPYLVQRKRVGNTYTTGYFRR